MRKPAIMFLLGILLFLSCLLAVIARNGQSVDSSSEKEEIKKQQILKMEAEKQLLWELRQIESGKAAVPGTDPALRSKAEMEIRAKIRMLQAGKRMMDPSRAQAHKAARNKKDFDSSSYGGSISGRVTDSSGVGIQNIYVAAWGMINEAESYNYYGYTDVNGNYTISNIAVISHVWVEFYRNGQDYDSEYYPDYVTVISGSNTPNIDVQLADAGTISGQVTDIFGTGINNTHVSIHYLNYEQQYYNGYTDANGNYSISGLPVGDVKVEFHGSRSLDCAPEWYNDKTSSVTADPVTVNARRVTPHIDAQLGAGGHISGRVTDASGNGGQNISVMVYDLDNEYITETYPDASGNYTVLGLPTGSFKVLFQNHNGKKTYCDEWYDNKSSFALADPVAVIAGSTTPNIDAHLTAGGKISGRVTGTSGEGIEDIYASVYDMEDSRVIFDRTDALGSYEIPYVLPGTYKIFFSDDYYREITSQWYNARSSFTTADQITVTEGLTVTDINARLAAAGKIAGQVTDASGIGIKNISVFVYEMDNKNSRLGNGITDAVGNFLVSGLPAGSYKVYFSDDANIKKYISEWYNDKKSFAEADPVAVVTGRTTHCSAQLAAAISNSSTVLFPNGGESWMVGTVHPITWTSTGAIANVTIEVSTDNGSHWSDVSASVVNDGNFNWTIPDTFSSRCLVRVSDAAHAATSDTSDAVFSIIMNLDLQAERHEVRSFATLRQYGQIQFLGGNSDVSVDQYRIMRRQGSGDFLMVRTVAFSELQNNQFQMQDKYLQNDILYTYRVEAYNAAGQLVGRSAEILI